MKAVVGVFKSRTDAEPGAAELAPLEISEDRLNILTPEVADEEIAAGVNRGGSTARHRCGNRRRKVGNNPTVALARQGCANDVTLRKCDLLPHPIRSLQLLIPVSRFVLRGC
jgi:hypothetical protein